MLFGCFGTAAIVLCGCITQRACEKFEVQRPPGYLESNETDETSLHACRHTPNACIWYLFTGDHGVLDTVLNKTMVTMSQGSTGYSLAYLLILTHFLQLLAMTFTAAQKGWDRVALVFLILFEFLWRLQYRDCRIVERWLQDEEVDVVLKSFQFTGRTMMMGAIHSLSRSDQVYWMDGIIAHHPRRNAWLERLRILGTREEEDLYLLDKMSNWKDRDARYIQLSSELAFDSAGVLRAELELTLEV